MIVFLIDYTENFKNRYIFHTAPPNMSLVRDTPDYVNIRTLTARYGNDVNALQFKLQETKTFG